MKRREVIVIALLIVAALCIPAWILYGGMSDAAEREWLERPYEGTLADFHREHIGLLDEAVQVFTAHPEIFDSYFEWSGADAAHVSLLGDRAGYAPGHLLPEAEREAVQRVYGLKGCHELVYRPGLYMRGQGWLDCPVLIFSVRTTREGWDGRLIWLPEDAQPEAAAQALALLGELYESIEKTAYPNWYAAAC